MDDPAAALNILFTILSDGSFALIVGVLLAKCWLSHDPAAARVRPRRLAAGPLAVLVLSHLVRPWFLAASMGGSTRFREAMDLIPTVLSSTRQGRIWYAGCGALTCLVAAYFLRELRCTWISTGALCVLAAIKAACGHASEAGDFSLPEIAQFLHIAAMSIWAGSIIVSGFFVVPFLKRLGGYGALWSYGGRLSQSVTYALIVLVGSGLYISWSDRHGAIGSIVTTTWGKTLLIKVTLAGLTAVLGSLVRFRCVKRPATAERSVMMMKLMRAEAVAMVVILCVSGLLANSNPAE